MECACSCAQNKDILDNTTLTKESVQIVVFGGPREKFSKSEITVVKNFLEGGGSVIMMLGEGGESRYDTNINYLLVILPTQLLRATHLCIACMYDDLYLNPVRNNTDCSSTRTARCEQSTTSTTTQRSCAYRMAF